MSKKKTHEEYVQEVAEINSNIEVVEEYIDARTKISHRCKICNNEWVATPDKILRGCGCPKCAGNIKLTHEEYVDRVKNINSNIDVVGKYINATTKIMHKCRIDGYEWNAYPNHILRGSGCPECVGLRKKTHEEYVQEVANLNPNIEVIGKYKNINTKILHKCKVDGYEWEITPYCILGMKQGCPKCFGNIKKTHEEYISQVAEINPNIEVLGDYIDYHTKILHKCKIDGYEWYVNPANVLCSRRGCPRCSGKEIYGHDEYIKRVAKIDLNIEVLGRYIDNQTKILHRCKLDGHEWNAKPSNILHGKGCPKCKSSKGEKAISMWLDKKDILYEPQKIFEDCKNILFLPFDFYLPKYNICIEFQGRQHYEPVDYFGGEKSFEIQILRDNIKKEYCQKNNIILFEIPYYSDLDDELIKLYNLIEISNMKKGVVT